MQKTNIRTSTRSKCVIHYECSDYSTHAQLSGNTLEGDLDLTSIVATKCGLFGESIQFLQIDQNLFSIMALDKFQRGCKAEAIDECGVWCACTVISRTKEVVTVAFNGWSAEWNRHVHDPREIRESTDDLGVKRKRSTTTLSSKVG